MSASIITGDKTIDDNLAKLGASVANKLARYALQAGISVISKAMRKAAPVGPTGQLKRSIGSRVSKTSDGFVAKAGVNVGKRTVKRKVRFAPHAHLFALGTQARYRQTIGGKFAYVRNPTREQLSTGTMPANSFIRQAYSISRSAAITAMQNKAATALVKEVAKLKK